METSEIWLKSLDLASIATWLMIIGVAVLIYVSKSSKSTPKSKK